MHVRLLPYLMIACVQSLCAAEYAQQSITGSMPTYLEACSKAVEDPSYFQTFRSRPEYGPILECGFGGESAQYLLNKASSQTLAKLELFRRLDQYGAPVTNDIPGVGRFSGTTLRYVVIADQITKFFSLPSQPVIAEVGAGFGGQCYILSHAIPFSKYFIYDLPEVECLIGKMMQTLAVKNVSLMPLQSQLPVGKIDLLVSNYAFSECSRETQLSYFERVLSKADRGYIIFNKLGCFNSLSAEELVQLLDERHMNPQVHPEPIFTYQDNVLITWDKNRSE